jgi:hypothetical protein
MTKQLQFELWEECGSNCTFCYLKDQNKFTPDYLKIKACNDALEAISDLSIYPTYDTISYLGGEFFQGQMRNPDVKSAFMKLMAKTAELLNEGYIKHVWLYATMTIGNQTDLYETLELFKNTKGEFWILTSYDTIGRFHTNKMFETWDYHMKNIHKLYPNFLFNITTILSEDCIEKYLSGELSFKKMMEEYNASFFFKQCGTPGSTPAEFNKKILPKFVPTRHKFLQFLTKFKQQESELMWDKLFNIKYRADVLYRNGNTDDSRMQLNIRHKKGEKEIQLNHECDETEVLSCGHMRSYSAYSDCEGCVLCDKELIGEM